MPLFSLLVIAVLFDQFIEAQNSSRGDYASGKCPISGQVIGSSSSVLGELEIELVGQDNRVRQRVRVLNGAFDFDSVPPGWYHFRTYNERGILFANGAGWLTGKDDWVILRTPDRPSTVAFSTLRHKIPRTAFNAFKAAAKATEKGDLRKSIELLKKAITADPLFASARYNLAVHYSALGLDEEALPHAQAAFELDPELPDLGYNFATLLIRVKRYGDAEAVIRRVLASKPASPDLRSLLTVTLIREGRDLEEAYHELRFASAEYPVARLLAAKALADTGRLTAAEVQVQEYLRSRLPDCERRRWENWLADVRPPDTAIAVADTE